jgi:hypothetical protein
VERDAKPVGGGEVVARNAGALGDERRAEDGGADHPVGRALGFPLAQDGAVDVVGVVRAVLAAELRARRVDVLLAVAGVCRGASEQISPRRRPGIWERASRSRGVPGQYSYLDGAVRESLQVLEIAFFAAMVAGSSGSGFRSRYSAHCEGGGERGEV